MLDRLQGLRRLGPSVKREVVHPSDLTTEVRQKAYIPQPFLQQTATVDICENARPLSTLK